MATTWVLRLTVITVFRLFLLDFSEFFFFPSALYHVWMVPQSLFRGVHVEIWRRTGWGNCWIFLLLLPLVYGSFTWHSNDFEALPGKRLRSFWSLSQLFILTNLVIKSLQKIRFENIQNRRPHGSSIKHGGFWDFWMCRASADDQSPDIPFRIRWILGNSIRPV